MPLAPANLNALDTGVLVELTWQDQSGDELGFRVYRNVNTGAFVLWQTLAANVTLVQDTGVGMGTMYTYYVVAYNANGESFPSNTQELTFGA